MVKTKLFYKPAHAIIADCIPYYENGVYHIFYLLDYRLKEEVGTPWFKITTKDFVTFKDHGEMLKRGHKEEYDQYVFTGSVFKTPDGLYHIWYTGHNIDMEPGNYVQAVMHAVSKDLENWTKIPEDTFIAPSSGEYEHRDWRDPYVFFNEQTKEYNMLLTTRMSNGPKLRRGATTLLVSKDFKKWEIKRPFYAPELYYAHECPDLFKMGEWYYHVFSEFSRYHVTRYVMAKSLAGPWLKPRNDKFDGRAYYAAKTVSDGQRRFILGWNPTKEGNVDNGLWQWGGNLVVHELFQNKDGTLRVKMVDEIDNAFAKGQALKFVTRDKKPVDLSHIESLTKVFTAYSEVDNTNTYQLEFKFRYHSKAARIGLLLNTSPEDDTGYGFFVEPHHQRLVFELFPVFPQYSYLSVYLERPISVKEGTLNTLKVIVEDNMAIAYLNDEVALSTRMYNFKSNKVGVLVHGEASVENITFKKIK